MNEAIIIVIKSIKIIKFKLSYSFRCIYSSDATWFHDDDDEDGMRARCLLSLLRMYRPKKSERRFATFLHSILCVRKISVEIKSAAQLQMEMMAEAMVLSEIVIHS